MSIEQRYLLHKCRFFLLDNVYHVAIVTLLNFIAYARLVLMEGYVQTAVVAVAGMIAMLSIILGLERMIRIIMANYFAASILLGLGNFIELLSNRLLIGPAERWVDGLQHWVGKLMIAGKPTFLLTVYFLLLIFIVTKSHIGLGRIKNEAIRCVLIVVFLPCTIISILLSVGLAIFGNQIINLDELQLLANHVSHIPYAYNFVMLTPLWIILPGVITILVAAFVLRTNDNVVRKEFVLDFDKDTEKPRLEIPD